MKEFISIPNIITASRVLFLFLNIFLLTKGNFLLALIVYLFNSLLDKLDGYVAKKYNLITSFGKFFDQNIDKLIHLSLFITFISLGININLYLIILLMTRESVMVTLRIIAFSKNIALVAPDILKIKNLVEVAAISLVIIQGINSSISVMGIVNILLIIDVLLGFSNFYFYFKTYQRKLTEKVVSK